MVDRPLFVYTPVAVGVAEEEVMAFTESLTLQFLRLLQC